MSGIRDWLEANGLGKHVDLFEENDIDVELLPRLTREDIDELGLSVGAKRRLLDALSTLTNETSHTPEPASPATDPNPSRHPRSEAAERRQLTVMFCDLVGSTELSQKLDPEALRELMRAYQQSCGNVIEKYDGHVAQYLGDGLMTYFGWPHAHEDDAERAIRAGLEIVESVKQVQAPDALQVRIGIATGPVVVGETGGGDASVPKLAVGETPNLAARIQGLARADQIVIGPITRRLVGGTFDLVDAGEHELKGIVSSVRTWLVDGLARSEGRFEAAHGQSELAPLVGRDQELGLLMARWQIAQEGEGQVVLLSGDPGIGKSHIVSTLSERLEEQGAQSFRFQCSPYQVNRAYSPFIDNFERALKFGNDESSDAKLDKLEALVVSRFGRPLADVRFIASILSIPDEERYGPLTITPQKHKDETLRALSSLAEAAARVQPSVTIFEDLHWADPTTLEVLDLLIDRVTDVPLLIVLTHRPEFKNRWTHFDHVVDMKLPRITRPQSSALVSSITGGKRLPPKLLEQILAKTDGVPLYVEELTRSIIESGEVEERENHYEYTGPTQTVTVPETLRDSLMARLDRQAPVKELAQIGAVIGREFSHELIHAVAPSDADEIDEALVQLTDSGLAFRRGSPPDASYTFKHALVQDAAYDSLLNSRRQELHGKIAEAIEEQFISRAIRERFANFKSAEPEVLAHHYTEAGETAQAIPYWQQAGQSSVQRSANSEAINYFTRGLELLATLPETKNSGDRELDMRIALGQAIIAVNGWASPKVKNVYDKALKVCDRLGDAPQRFLVMRGLRMYHTVHGEIETGLQLARQMLDYARNAKNPELLADANWVMGATLMYTGDFTQSRSYLEAGLAYCDEQKNQNVLPGRDADTRVLCLVWLTRVLFSLGFPAQAGKCVSDALAFTDDMSMPFSRAHVLQTSSDFCLWVGDWEQASAHAEALDKLSVEQAFTGWIALASVNRGLSIARLGDVGQGIDLVRKGIAAGRTIGSEIMFPSLLVQLADVCGEMGEIEAGQLALQEAKEIAEKNNEGYYLSEQHRVRGELVLRGAGNRDELERSAEVGFLEALSL